MPHPTLQPTLVMGARGHVGRLVLESLLAQGVPVRASARRPVPGQLPASVDVVAADLTDPGSLAAAFRGVRQVFLYAQPEGVDGVVRAAREAEVEQMVLLSSGSVLDPFAVGNAITEEHRAVEDAYAAADGLTVVPIRPLVLATNALGWSWSAKDGGPVPLYQPDALTAPVHERDVAAVAVAALTGGDVEAVSGMLTGPVRTSQRDQVAAIAAATGRELVVQALDRPAALERFARFMPEHEAAAVLRFLDEAAAGHSPATATVPDVLGRGATPFEVWAADHTDDFR